jgi:protein-S-isoprenylcysteine O-methyltransferase Ste14
MYLYFILTALLGMLAGLVIARRADMLSMFRADTPIKDKKVLQFLTVAVVVGTFAFVHIRANDTDVSWGWVLTLTLTILSFLGPDAFIKFANTIGSALVARVKPSA